MCHPYPQPKWRKSSITNSPGIILKPPAVIMDNREGHCSAKSFVCCVFNVGNPVTGALGASASEQLHTNYTHSSGSYIHIFLLHSSEDSQRLTPSCSCCVFILHLPLSSRTVMRASSPHLLCSWKKLLMHWRNKCLLFTDRRYFSLVLFNKGQRRLWEAVKRRKAMCKRKSWMSKVTDTRKH